MSLKMMLLLAIPIGIGVLGSKKKKAAPAPPSPTGNGTVPAGTPPPGGGGGIPGGWPPPQPKPPAPGSWLDSLPESYTTRREAQILDAVAAGLAADPEWITIESPGAGKYSGYTMHVPVMADALTIEGVRVNGSYPTAQAIADREGWLLFTPYIAGLVWKHADAKLSPTTSQELSNKNVTATTSQMIEASAKVDQKLNPIRTPRDADGLVTLVGNPGKDWVLTRIYGDGGEHPVSHVPHIDAGANHGFYRGLWDPIQNVGVFHGLGHVDYSQTLRFMGPMSALEAPDGTRKNINNAAAMMDPELAHMLTGQTNKIYGRQVGEGPLKYDRHPRLPLGTLV
jgi:hypothetical protein